MTPMFPRFSIPVPSRTAPASTRAITVLVLALLVAACGGAGIDPVSFDPGTACSSAADEGRYAGAYPQLEGLLPTSYEGQAPTFRDSGRSCTPESLGTFAERGFTEVKFAGTVWDIGNGQGLTMAVFEAPGLDAERVIEFYEAGARAARRTEDLRRSDTQVGDQPAKRLDVLYGTSAQTVVSWPEDAAAGRIRALLSADLGDAKVLELLDRIARDEF